LLQEKKVYLNLKERKEQKMTEDTLCASAICWFENGYMMKTSYFVLFEILLILLKSRIILKAVQVTQGEKRKRQKYFSRKLEGRKPHGRQDLVEK
jgi:hypothetical protein